MTATRDNGTRVTASRKEMTNSDADKPIDRVLGALLKAGSVARPSGGEWAAQCPVHDDGTPSLCIGVGDEDRALIYCQAGCSTEDVLAALKLTKADLFVGRPKRNRPEPVRSYVYTDEDGKPLYRSVRHAQKHFHQERWNGDVWVTGPGCMKGLHRRVPYRLPKVVAAIAAGQLVVVVEGEKDADRLASLGICATTNAGGAGKWKQASLDAPFQGATVAIIPDNDDPGWDHAQLVAAHLHPLASSVKVVHVCGDLPEKADVSDWLDDDEHSADQLLQLIAAGEEWSPEDRGRSRGTPPPQNRRNHATPPLDLACDLDILGRFASAMVGCGLVGERATAQLLYLVMTSRLLDRPVSTAIKGESSAGKSHVEQLVRSFFPDEAVVVMTAMSERALIYLDDDLRHRVLVLYEAVALREGVHEDLTSYLVRSLVSEGSIRYPVSQRTKEGGYKAKEIVREGPVALVVTTTRARVHRENETRLLSITVDDSPQQTRAILRSLAAERGEADLSEWKQLQTWLQDAEHRVTIPFAVALAELVPPVATRLRRDFGAVLSLIKSHAILHQLSRERDDQGRIVATLDDYEQVRRLIAPLLSEGVGATVSTATRETVAAVVKLATAFGVTAAQLTGELGVHKATVTRRLSVAAEGGWVINNEERRGRPGRWVRGEPLPEGQSLLPTVAEVVRTVASADAPGRDDESAGQDQ